MTTTTTSRKSTDFTTKPIEFERLLYERRQSVSRVRRAEFCCISFHFTSFYFVFCCTFFTFSFNRSDTHTHTHTLEHTVYIVESYIADVSKCMHSMAIQERTASLTVRSRITYHIVIDKRTTQTTKGGLQNTTTNRTKRSKEVKGLKKR